MFNGYVPLKSVRDVSYVRQQVCRHVDGDCKPDAALVVDEELGNILFHSSEKAARVIARGRRVIIVHPEIRRAYDDEPGARPLEQVLAEYETIRKSLGLGRQLSKEFGAVYSDGWVYAYFPRGKGGTA